MKLEAAALTDIGRVRKSNQDSVGCYPAIGLFLLADGMGGLADGEVASRLAIDVIRDHFPEPAGPSGSSADDFASLLAAIEAANQRIVREGEERAEQTEGAALGATIVALRLAPDAERASWAHVGDSRLYRVRGRELVLLTADHTLAGASYRDQRPIPLDLQHTNMLVQALGVGPDVEPSFGSDELRPGDVYLLCSDGVSGLVPPHALERELLAGGAVEETARNLIRLALDGGGRDNASVVLVRVVEP